MGDLGDADRGVGGTRGRGMRRSAYDRRRAVPGRLALVGVALLAITGAGLATRPSAAAAPTPTPIRVVISTGPKATATATGAARPTTAARPLATATTATTAGGQTATASFTAADWQGGYYQGNGRYYGRAWVAVYGAASAYPRATLRFRLEAVPAAGATLTLTGLDDELVGNNPIEVDVNGQRLYVGDSPFPSWDGVGNGADAAWTAVQITLPARLLQAGDNEVGVANRSPSGNFGLPPYVLLAEASLAAPGGNPHVLPPVAAPTPSA